MSKILGKDVVQDGAYFIMHPNGLQHHKDGHPSCICDVAHGHVVFFGDGPSKPLSDYAEFWFILIPYPTHAAWSGESRKIETIKWADVKDGRYWMFDSAGEDQEPSACTIFTNGVTLVYFDDLDVEGKSIVVDIDSLVDTVVFVPINPPRFSELKL